MTGYFDGFVLPVPMKLIVSFLQISISYVICGLLLIQNIGPEGFERKNFKIWTQETDGPNYCYAVYTFPMGYKSLAA